jgi:hypothetical protein
MALEHRCNNFVLSTPWVVPRAVPKVFGEILEGVAIALSEETCRPFGF